MFWTLPGPIIFGSLSWAAQGVSVGSSLSALPIYPSLALTAIFVGSVMDALRIFDMTKTIFTCTESVQDFLFLREPTTQSTGPCVTNKMPHFRSNSQSMLGSERACYDRTNAQTYARTTNCIIQAFEASLSVDPLFETPLLENITLHINQYELMMVAGPTGCGKSTLLHSIMGQEALISGQLRRSISTTGYCSQIPWLWQVSIRDNIIGFERFDAGWYSQVIHACLLKQDFLQLANGDLTLVGNNGSNLSRGQRLRIVRVTIISSYILLIS